MYTQLLEPEQISHTQTNRANVYTPMWKSNLKHSMAELQSIQQFWLQLDIALEMFTVALEVFRVALEVFTEARISSTYKLW